MKNSAYITPFIIGGALGSLYLIWGIFTSTNSTAAIGFIMIPIFGIMGGVIGAALAHIGYVIMGRQKILSIQSLAVMIVGLLIMADIWSDHKREVLLNEAKETSSVERMRELAQTSDQELAGKLAENSHINLEIARTLVERWRLDYYIQGNLASNPRLPHEMLPILGRPGEFPENKKVEERLFQTMVLAKLMKHPALPEDVFHEIAARKDIEHFLALAILESPRSTCEEMRPFLQAKNPVLGATAERTMKAKGCSL